MEDSSARLIRYVLLRTCLATGMLTQLAKAAVGRYVPRDSLAAANLARRVACVRRVDKQLCQRPYNRQGTSTLDKAEKSKTELHRSTLLRPLIYISAWIID